MAIAPHPPAVNLNKGFPTRARYRRRPNDDWGKKMTLLNSKAINIALVAAIAGLALVLAGLSLFHAGDGMAAHATHAPAITRDTGSQEEPGMSHSARFNVRKVESRNGLSTAAASTQRRCCSNEEAAVPSRNPNQPEIARSTEKQPSEKAASPTDHRDGHAMAH
jgi:hypothetical protein